MRSSTWMPVLVAVVLAGCDEKAPPDAGGSAAPKARTDVELQVVVIDEPHIVQAIERVRGEWKQLSGGTLAVTPTPPAAFAEGKLPAGDLVVFPSRYLGALAESELLRPVRASVMKAKGMDPPDVFPVLRDHLTHYGGTPVALTLGAAPAALVCDQQLPEQLGESASTWSQLAQAKRQHANGAEWTFRLPSADDAAAHLLLRHAAGYAVHRNRAAALFDPESMRPRITAPPFERALKELCQLAGMDAAQTANRTVRVARLTTNMPPAEPHFAVLALPGVDAVYHPSQQRWDQTLDGPRRVTYYDGSEGMVAVAKASRNAPAAFKLAAWLASKPDTPGGMRPRIGLARQSQVRAFRPFGSEAAYASLNETAAQSAAAALRSTEWLSAPRIPGVDRYLQVLGEQVRAAAAQPDVSPTDALQRAASAWDAITDELGREAQQAAYRRSLNL